MRGTSVELQELIEVKQLPEALSLPPGTSRSSESTEPIPGSLLRLSLRREIKPVEDGNHILISPQMPSVCFIKEIRYASVKAIHSIKCILPFFYLICRLLTFSFISVLMFFLYIWRF